MVHKGLRVTLSIIISILVLASIILLFGTENSGALYFTIMLQLVASAFAVNYMLKDFGKDGAKSYHSFTIAFMLLQGMSAVLMIIVGRKIPCITFAAIAFIITGILAFAKNLGKKRSFILIGIVSVINIIKLVMFLVSHPFDIGAVLITSLIVLSLVYTICMRGKYLDKDARGTI